jgi:hypothetical protein
MVPLYWCVNGAFSDAGVAFLDRVLYFQLIEMTCSSHAFSSRINELYQENLW